MGRIYAIANQKGGVGKTTTTVNLGAFMASFGQRILIIDLDPQANASSCLGIDKKNVKNGTYEVIIGESQAIKNILYNQRLKLSLLPSSANLAGAEIELVPVLARESRLKDALKPVVDRYDYILIDCPPSLSLLTLNGVVAAKDGVIIPVQCEYLALEGFGQLNQTLSRIRTALSPNLRVRGVVLTMFDIRTKLSADVVYEINSHFPGQVFSTIIPRSVRLAEAPSYGQPISVYAPHSNGAQAYANLAREILEGDGVFIPQPIQSLVTAP
jgi:chromosome partitioning protein